MKLRLTGVVLAALIVVPGIGQAVGFGVGIRMQFRNDVTEVEKGIYEVVSYGTSAPVSYWCGIGDYAIRTLRTKATQRIYLWKAYGPSVSRPGKKGAQFSLTPPEGVDTTPGYSVTVKTVGDNMSAGSAQGYCYDNFIDMGF